MGPMFRAREPYILNMAVGIADPMPPVYLVWPPRNPRFDETLLNAGVGYLAEA